MAEQPTETTVENTARSFSVEVPNATGAEEDAGLPVYLRLGTPDPDSPREQAHFAGVDMAGQTPGILMLSPGRIGMVAASRDSVVTAKEALSVLFDETQLLSATYNYTDHSGGAERELVFRRSLGTTFVMGEEETIELAQKAQISVGNEQKVGVSTGFEATVGVAVELNLSAKAEFGLEGADVRSPLLGQYSTADKKTVEATETISIQCNPLAEAYMVQIKVFSIAMQAATGILAGLSGAAAVVMGSLIAAGTINAAPEGADETALVARSGAVQLDTIKERLQNLRSTYIAVLAVLTVLQAAGIVLGALALVYKKLGGGVVFPSITVTPLGITIACGAASSIEMTPLGITMMVGPTSFELTAGTASVTALSTSIDGATMAVTSAASISMTAPAITFQ